MSWVDAAKLRKPLALAAGALALAVGGVAMAQAVVVRSTGPSAAQYPMGKKLPANGTLALKAGDNVTLIDKSGTRVIKGPGSFPVNAAISRDQASALAMAQMATTPGGARVRTGAVRGAPTEAVAIAAGPDSIWYLDVTKGGTFCMADPQQVVLWRPDATETGMGKLTGSDGTTADVTWNAGNPLKLWPTETLPIVDGKAYDFRNPVGHSVSIRIKQLTSVPTDAMDMASLLAASGCTAQLDVLANTTTATGG